MHVINDFKAMLDLKHIVKGAADGTDAPNASTLEGDEKVLALKMVRLVC